MLYGEIRKVDFSPNVGAEIGKVRPAIIIFNNTVGVLPLKIVIPITDPAAKIQSWHVPLIPSGENGLTKISVADCFQIKSVSKNRIKQKIGVLSESELASVKIALVTVLDLI